MFSSFLAGNTLYIHNKNQLVNSVWGEKLLYFVKTISNANALCGQNAKTYYVKAGDIRARIHTHTHTQRVITGLYKVNSGVVG